MKDRAAYQTAGASQQTVESSGTSHMPVSAESEKSRTKRATSAPGLSFPRFFTEAGVDPFDETEWELRAAVIGSQGGDVFLARAFSVSAETEGRCGVPVLSTVCWLAPAAW